MNGEPAQPLLVSMLLYLDDQWPRDWGAETLFLDDEVRDHLQTRTELQSHHGCASGDEMRQQANTSFQYTGISSANSCRKDSL